MKRLSIITVLTIWTIFSAGAQSLIEINYNGSTAKVNIPSYITDVTYSINGANVIINSSTTSTEYTYRVAGTSADGSLVINGSYKLTLQLAGVDLTNARGGTAIDVECGKRIAVELKDGTVNRLADVDGNHNSVLYFKGHAEFSGGGTLNVVGSANHAICAKEYIELKSSTGIINILGAPGDGLHCGKGEVKNTNNYFLMKGGVVNIMNVDGDGVDSDNYGTIKIQGGAISINVGNDAAGLKADSIITVSGGNVNISVAGANSQGLCAHYATDITGGQVNIAVSGNGSKGIQGKNNTSMTVSNGGFVNISGGDTRILVTGGDQSGTDGSVSKCMGISVDANFALTDGIVSITALGSQACTYDVKGTETTGGTLDVVRVPWTFNPTDYKNDMSAYVTVSASGRKLNDYSQIALGAFIDGRCAGYATFPSSDYGIMRIYSNSTDAQNVTFRIYDYSTGKEFVLTPSSAVYFSNMSVVGTPSSPFSLTYNSSYPQGDVNHDGQVNIIDVTSIISFILGQTPTYFYPDQADVNIDGKVNIIDVTSVIDIILNGKK